MKLEYVPLLRRHRALHDIPRGPARFGHYLRMMLNAEGTEAELAPLVAINPMARDHVTVLLDALLALDADEIGLRATEEATEVLAEVPGTARASLVVVDDLGGGWTNRFACEFEHRFGPSPGRGPSTREGRPSRPRAIWLTGILWSSESSSARLTREAILSVAHRVAYQHRHGTARTLRQRLAQEGHVLASTGTEGPTLEPDDLEYTRAILEPLVETDDMRTTIECLFGDAAGATLGFTPRGLSPGAGLALAREDALSYRARLAGASSFENKE